MERLKCVAGWFRRNYILSALIIFSTVAYAVVHLPPVVTSSVQVTDLTDSTALVTDSSDNLTSSSVTSTELGYVHGVTSSLCGINQSCTLTNKTLTSPAFTTPSTDIMTFAEQSSAPTSPSSGNVTIYPDSTGKMYILNSSGTKTPIGSGGSGGSKNYLSDITTANGTNSISGDFETGSDSGWDLGNVTLTNYFPSGTPTFGSGSSTTLSESIISTGQLDGSYSLEYADTTATTAGDFLSTPAFYIDSDQGHQEGFSFKYKVTSGESNMKFGGTYDDTSEAVAAYDVTDSAWIAVNGQACMTTGSGVGICSGSFQVPDGAKELRLVMYNAQATSDAITIVVDSFNVGPQILNQGPPVTDWVSYTPTIGAVTTAPSVGTNSLSAHYRRVGDSLEISFILSQTSAGSAGSGTYLFPLPAGYSIDTEKASISTNSNGAGGTSVGVAQVSNTTSTSSTNATVGDVIPYNSTSLAIYVAGASAQELLAVGSSAYALSGSTIYYSFTATVPIAGWSSNVQMSSDAGNSVPVIAIASHGSYSTTSGAAIPFDTVVYDNTDSITESTGRFTSNRKACYTVSAIGSQTSAGYNLAVYKNGSILNNLFSFSNDSYETSGTTTVCLLAGDYIDFRVNGAISLSDLSVSISQIMGNQTIAASDTIAARYLNTAGTTVNTTESAIPFATRDYDSTGSFSGSTFKVPQSGKYRVKAYLTTAAVATAGYIYVDLYKNGSFYSRIGSNEFSSTSYNWQVMASGDVSCLSGDTLQLYVYSSVSTTLFETSGYNWVSFLRVGNY